MRIVCTDNEIPIVDQSALLRSAVLSVMHKVDPEGCARLPCDTKTWRAWLTDDPPPMTTDTMELFVSVIKVRLYTLEPFGCLRVPRLARSLGYRQGRAATLLFEANVKDHLIIPHCGDSSESIEDHK
jgi:hypothetical protein